MRDYQRKHNNPYLLPHNVQKQALYAIRDYERLTQERDAIRRGGQTEFERNFACGVERPTEERAIRLVMIEERIAAIDQAFAQLPPEYRRAVFENIVSGARYPITISQATGARWRGRAVFFTAQNLNLI